MEWHDVWVPNETSLRVLNQYILDPAILLENCPLDYGRHTPDARLGNFHMPIGNLGHISKLPFELQHHVLLSLDVQTLLTVRQVCWMGMDAVNGLPEWRKIMAHAPNTIRMAIGIHTAHTFTISELYAKLVQRTCDTTACNNLAPYLDVFTLSRRCLSVGGPCSPTRILGPRNHSSLQDYCEFDAGLLSHVPSFRAIEGTYGQKYNQLSVQYTETMFFDQDGQPAWKPRDTNIYYDTAAVHLKTGKHDPVLRLTDQQADKIGLDPHWKLAAVVAPWLVDGGRTAEYGTFCEYCLRDYTREYRHFRDAYWMYLCRTEQFDLSLGAAAGEPSPIEASFGTVEEMERHVAECYL